MSETHLPEDSSRYDKKLNLLVAYPYFTQDILNELKLIPRSKYRLILDSGAFTAHNTGAEVTLDGYCSFLDGLLSKDLSIEAYVQLDVVFNERETIANYEEMLRRGFNPAPVFTRGTDEARFFELCEAGKYVFVGGVQRGINNRNFAKWILENSERYKVHLLAFTKPNFLNYYKPYSVDSSSWSRTCRFGFLECFEDGRIYSLTRKDFAKAPPESFIRQQRRLGISLNALKSLGYQGSWNSIGYTGEPITRPGPIKGLAQWISIVNWVFYSVHAQNKIGTKIYLAFPQSTHLRLIRLAYEYLEQRKLL